LHVCTHRAGFSVFHIYPKEERQLRDLLRKRLILVNQCTSHILGFQSLCNRNIAESISSNEIKKLKVEDIGGMFENKHLILSGESNIYMVRCFQERIAILEKEILKVAKLKPEFQRLLEIKTGAVGSNVQIGAALLIDFFLISFLLCLPSCFELCVSFRL
jgi:hypothetical protein